MGKEITCYFVTAPKRQMTSRRLEILPAGSSNRSRDNDI